MDSVRQAPMIGMPPHVRERLAALTKQPESIDAVPTFKQEIQKRRYDNVSTRFDATGPSQLKSVVEHGREVHEASQVPTLPSWLEPEKHTAAVSTVVRDASRVVPIHAIPAGESPQVLLHASVQADNPNPHPVGVELGILHPNGKFEVYERTTTHTGDGNKFAHVVAPRETINAAPATCFSLDKANTTPFAYYFQGTPVSALGKGIREVEDMLLIERNHPVREIYEENAPRNQWPPIMASPFNGYVIAPSRQVKMCIDTLAEHIGKLDPCIEPRCQLAVRVRALPTAKPGLQIGAEPVFLKLQYYLGKRQDVPAAAAADAEMMP